MYKIILVLDFGDGDPSEVSIKDDNKPEQKLCNFLCDYYLNLRKLGRIIAALFILIIFMSQYEFVEKLNNMKYIYV